jgi:GMP synthase-like glutamine amidotransferase
MEILALIHEQGPCSGVFADSAAERGDTIEEWSLAWGTRPARPLDEYDAVFAFGGVMNTHEEHYHPWLREENLLMQRFLDQGVPLLGICLGGQLIANAAHAPVTRATEPEIGWYDLELLGRSNDDPVFGGLPTVMKALQWHYYCFDLPGGAVPLARSPVCLQAFRLGELAWGLQFHCEVTREMLTDWIDAVVGQDEPGNDVLEEMRSGIDRHIEEWNDVGRTISTRFLQVAQRARPHVSPV